MLTVDEATTQLNAQFKNVFKGADLIKGLTGAYWSEGGEWMPEFADEAGDLWPACKRPVIPNFSSVADVKVAYEKCAKYMTDPATDKCLGVLLGCATGKTTKLTAKLASSGLFPKVYCVMPSMISAIQTAEYVQTNNPALMIHNVVNFDQGLSFVHGGAMLSALATGYDASNALIVLDEAHVLTPVYKVLREILSRLNVKVLMMTGSRTNMIQTVAGTTVKLVEPDDPELSKAVLSKTVSVVGAQPNLEPAVPANLLVGANLNVQSVYDTGLRVDPGITETKAGWTLVPGTRVAEKMEVTQMLSRVGRDAVPGQGRRVFHTPRQHAMPSDHPSYYELLEDALRVLSNLVADTNFTRYQALQVINQRHEKRVLRDDQKSTDPVMSKPEVNEIVMPTQSVDFNVKSAMKGDAASMLSSESSMSVVSSDSDLSKKFKPYLKQGGKLMSMDDGSGYKLILPDKRGGYGGPDPDALMRGDKRSLLHARTWIAPGTTVTIRNPDQTVYPIQHSLMNERDVFSSFVKGADKIYTDVNLFSVGDYDAKEHSQRLISRVLAGDVIPTYCHDERCAVMAMWNRMVVATQGRIPTLLANQVQQYARSYHMAHLGEE